MQKLLSLAIAKLKWPWLFILSLALFSIDLFIPDPVPFLDEVFMALVTAVLGSLRKKKPVEDDQK